MPQCARHLPGLSQRRFRGRNVSLGGAPVNRIGRATTARTRTRGVFGGGGRGRTRRPESPGRRHPERIADRVDDAYVVELATAVTGGRGGKVGVGVAPRVFLRKLVADVLDRVDGFAEFDPRRDYALTISRTELSEAERNAASAGEIELDLP